MDTLTKIRRRLSETDRKHEIIHAAIVVARRDGLDRMTARTVAQEAGTSHGLVLHHFHSMHGLQSEMLKEVLQRTLVLRLDNIEDVPRPLRITTFLRQQTQHFVEQSDLIGLLLDYRVHSANDSETEREIASALHAFRTSMEPFFANIIESDPSGYPNVTPTDLARLSASFFLGIAVQYTVVPTVPDIERLVTTIGAMFGPSQTKTVGSR